MRGHSNLFIKDKKVNRITYWVNAITLVFIFTQFCFPFGCIMRDVIKKFLSTYKNKNIFYLFLERGYGKEKERERNISVWLPVICPLLGTWPATQACALTGN